MCFCLLTLLHFKVVPSSGQDNCLAYVKPLYTWTRRAIQLLPLLIGLGITAGTGIGIGGIASSTSCYNQLSADLTNDTEQLVRP
jgi:hypothetical protein